VVKRQSSSLAMSGPGIYVPPEAGERSPGKTRGTASTAASQRTSGAQKTERSVEATEEASTNPKESGSIRNFLGDLLSSEPDTPTAREKPARKSKATSKNRSTSRATETLVAKLNAASRDIYEVLQDGLPKELEASYRQGNAQTYTHNLFQSRGRKLMDLTRKAYRDDKQTRTRIDGFIRLFERLLDTVATSEAGEELVDQCLGSETGKVYLMLAEAAGRVQH
jgi:hypothetical protein